MKSKILILRLLLCLLVLTGCSKNINPEPVKKISQKDSIRKDKQNLPDDTGARSKVKKGSIKIGRLEREVELKLLDGSPFSFYTYIPGDMDVERVRLGETVLI
ncbi:hypothetical protein Dred_2667 [Desulforamulus reducens MI-1]|uniref:Lipoprotein n=1 Tax=Desulforamulus reducens (strain ATCC BAA-1160 / DSM 100696 / MI-1) TaxID=349161 RepID=A4J7X0_DESRM|nr:hypothetical protein [Desulforamulus reducens]ABO51173.1 hypothetical protein Dred_2667 [Desulforamulus reducens MI-1]